MNLFALPLFQGVTDIMPDMKFSVDELQENKNVWTKKVEIETEKRRSKSGGAWDGRDDDVLSPKDGGSAASSIVRQTSSAPAEPSSKPSETLIPEPNVASSGTAARLATAPSPPSDQSRRSSPAPPNRLGQNPDIASRRSSGAFTGACTPPQTRRSSNTVPSQLQLGITYPPDGTYPHTDPSLVTVVVTSPGISPKSSDSKSAIPTKHENGYAERCSAGDRCSQGTNATNRLPYSPSTEATSFLSLESSVRSESDRPRTSPPSFADDKDSGELKSHSNVAMGTVKTLRQRPSRSKFRLTWWKSKKRPPIPSSP
jgi:3',5'-cyclic-nucleotide phosphodiesterase